MLLGGHWRNPTVAVTWRDQLLPDPKNNKDDTPILGGSNKQQMYGKFEGFPLLEGNFHQKLFMGPNPNGPRTK